MTTSERTLGRDDFSASLNAADDPQWDPFREAHVIEISIDLCDFESEAAMLAHSVMP